VAPAEADLATQKRQIDANPVIMRDKLAAQNPLGSNDPAVPYLYGRALLLTGQFDLAVTAFKRSAELLSAKPETDPLILDNAMSALAAATKSGKPDAIALAQSDLDRLIRPVAIPNQGPIPGGVAPSPTPPAPAASRPGPGIN
jgi:hypothetical protein